MSTAPPPVVEVAADLYYDPVKAAQRLDTLTSQFQARFGSAPDFLVRAPGRVNLIGEHIDYSGYGVLPMATEQDTVVLVKCTKKGEGATVHLENLLEKYPPRSFENPGIDIVIDSTIHEWSNYFIAGLKGVMEAYNDKKKTIGMDALVHGLVPTGSGLSSSSALVCAAALATMVANFPIENALSKQRIADCCVTGERYIGLESGGMDQAISFLAEKGKAQLIEFNPLRTKDVTLPAGCMFVIANSLVESNKYVTGSTCYNMRVVECRLSAVLLSFYMKLEWKQVRRLIDVQNQSKLSLHELQQKVQEYLHKDPYSIEEISKILNLDVSDLTTQYLGAVKNSSPFHLCQRASHVFAEAARVYEFYDLCEKPTAESLQQLGGLMNDSHQSCSDLFDCSCPELDTLTSICRKAGALGSRLTGAGWGGCTISLVPEVKLAPFLAAVTQEYYVNTLKMDEKEVTMSDILFATQPGGGAAICFTKAE